MLTPHACSPASQVANPSIAARRVQDACRDTLRRLGVAQLDLYLVHSPFTGVPLLETWREMEALVDAGLTRHIGVSNFRVGDIRELLAHARVRPAVNQLEFHPYLQQSELAQLCRSEGIALEAYCPLGPITLWPGGAVDEPVRAAAEAHGTTPASVLLAWPLALGHAVVTTSTKPGRAAEALRAAAIRLSDAEVEAIAAAGAAATQRRRFWVNDFGSA